MKLIIRLLAVLAAAAASCALAAPALASATPCPTSGCEVFSITGVIGTGAVMRGSTVLALGVSNSAGAGSALELRNFSTSRATEQFMPSSGQLVLDDGALCITGWATRVVLQQCSSGEHKYQQWEMNSNGQLVDSLTRRMLLVNSPGPYATVGVSTSAGTTWQSHAAS